MTIINVSARNILSSLWRGGQYAYLWTDNGKRSKWFQVDEPTTIPADWKDSNIYFSIHPCAAIPTENSRGEKVPPAQVRSQIKTITAIICVFGEFDAKDEVSTKEYTPFLPDDFDTLTDIAKKTAIKTAKEQAVVSDLAKYKQRAFARVENSARYPTLIIDSGGGYHAYWIFVEPVMVTDANRTHVQAVQAAWVDLIGCDPVSKDLARVLRVPGTSNVKPQYAPNFPIVSVIEYDEARIYSFAEIEQLTGLDEVTVAAKQAQQRTKKDNQDKPTDNVIAEFNRTHHIVDMLVDEGYTLGWERPEVARLSRPGRDKGQTSVVVFKAGEKEMSYHHSSSDPLYTIGHCRDAFDIYTVTDHKGDVKAAYEAAKREQGKWTEARSSKRQTVDPLTGEILKLEAVKPTTYTNGNGNGNGYHAQHGMTSKSSAEARQAKKAIVRRTYPQLLHDMQARSISEYNEHFTVTCLFNGEEGDATLLSSILRDNVVYDHSEGIWYWYNNLYWEPDKTWNIYQLTSDILSEIYKHLSIKKHTESIEIEKALLTNDNATQEQRDELKKIISISKAAKGRAVALNAINDVKRVLNFACAGLRLGISGNEWDSNVNLLGVENCVIDLNVGEPIEPKADQYIRTVAPVPYHKDWESPLWEKSLIEIFDNKTDDADYVQRLLGYAMSGTCVESDFPIWYGKEGRNGKEFILERIRNVLGEKLAGVAESELLLSTKQDRGKNSSTEGLMVLRGRRIAWASETNEGRMLDLASMKDLSGGHILTGRHNHGKQVEWKRTHTLILLTNHRPHIQSQALAEWDRVRLLEFPLSFVNNPDPEKPNQRQKDKTLGERIDRDELPGILNWLIAGCLAWRCMGLNEPESVKRATAQYKQDEDTLGHFIKETCIVGVGAKCKPIDLYKVYVEWIDRGGKPMGKKTFYTKIEERGFKRFLSMGFEYFDGIGILAV